MRIVFALIICLTAPLVAAGPESVEVRIVNGDVELAGTLVRPTTQGPYPGLVFVHGSGPHTRAGPLSYADTFAEAGVGLLAFDKRGTGESSGDWTRSSLEDLAGDIATAVAFLRQQAGFDPDRIGLWGVSQGGWIAPMVVARDARIAFMIVTSGGGASPLQSELFSYQQAFDLAGLPADQQAEAFAAIGQYFRYLGTGEGRTALIETLDRSQQRPWYAHASLKRITPSDAGRPNWAWVANWDPLLSIAAVRCPVLLVFGDKDRQQPTDLAIARWRQGLAMAGNADVRIQLFEGANHGIRKAGNAQGGHGRAPLVAGYRELLRDWLIEKAAASEL